LTRPAAVHFAASLVYSPIMNVQCEKCGTGYGLDETLVGPAGTTVRCTICGHVFKVHAPGGSRTESWVLRQASGATFPFDRLGTLQDWISEGKVSENDLIAKTGGEWKRLSDLAEMKPFFDAARGRQLRREVTQPVAAGFQKVKASEHAATIRSAPMVDARAPAPQQPVQHVTASYEAGPPGQQAPMARPVVPGVSPTAPTVRVVETPVAVPPAAAPAAGAAAREEAPAAAGIQYSSAYAPTMPAGYLAPAAVPAPQPQYQQQQVQPPSGPPAPVAGYQARGPGFAPVDPDLSQVPAAGEDERWVQGRQVATAGPAWAESSQVAIPSRREHEQEEDDLSPPRRRLGRWIALVVAVLVVGGGFYLFAFQRELVEGALGGLIGSPAEGRHQAFFMKGQEHFLLDTDLAFRQADREFQKTLALAEGDPATLATLATMYAVWSQYLRDEAIDARVDAMAEVAEGQEPDLREAERFEREAREKFEEARRWADQSRDSGADLPAISLALADVARLEGDLDEAESVVGAMGTEVADPGIGYVKGLVAIDRGRPADEVIRLLEQAAGGEELLRVVYRRARVLAAAGRGEEARRAIERILSLSRDHRRARSLQERLEAGLPVVLRVESMDDQALAAKEEPAGKEEGEDKGDPAEKAQVAVATASAETGGGPVGNIESLLTRAKRLQETGQPRQAMDLYETVLSREPGNIDAVSGMGWCFLDMGNRGQAITWFRRALGGGSGRFGPAIIGLAEAYKAQGQKAESLKWYRRYLELHPGGSDAGLARGNVERLEAELSQEAAPAGTVQPVSGDPGEAPAAPATTDPAPAPTPDPYAAEPAPAKPAPDVAADPEPEKKPPPDPYSAEE